MLKKEEIKQEIKDRLSFATVGKVWRIVRNVSGSLSAIALIIPNLPLNLNDNNKAWIYGIAGILAVISGRAHLDKSNTTKQ